MKPEIDRLLSALMSTALAKKLLAESDQETLKERKALAARLADLDKQAADELPKLAQQEREAAEAMRAAELAAVQARQDWAAAMSASMGASHRIEHQRAVLAAELRRTAPAAIGEFKSRWLDEVERLRRMHPEVTTITKERRMFGPDLTETWSNWASVNARLSALRAGLRQLDDVALLAVPDSEMRGKLELIEAEFAQIENSIITAA